MKKLLLIFILTSTYLSAVEILEEFYVMKNLIPYIEQGNVYEINGMKVRGAKVNMKMLKALKTTDNPFYFYNSKREKTMVKIGDYVISPLTLCEIYSVTKEEFKENFIEN